MSAPRTDNLRGWRQPPVHTTLRVYLRGSAAMPPARRVAVHGGTDGHQVASALIAGMRDVQPRSLVAAEVLAQVAARIDPATRALAIYSRDTRPELVAWLCRELKASTTITHTEHHVIPPSGRRRRES